MARLVAALERDLTTDFALLFVQQEGIAPEAATWTFAASEPGTLAMITGMKYSDLRVRVERWDSRPDWVGDDWEDCDELPWAPVPGGGRLSVSGFDAPTGKGLLIEDIGPARVQVFASGRHQYSNTSEDLAHYEPERWLLRLWPEPGPPEPLAGPPRRIAGPLPFFVERSPWEAAVHGWQVAGWPSELSQLSAFREIENAVHRVGRPFERDDLTPLLRRGVDWTSPVNGSVPMTVEGRRRDPGPYELLEQLATITGLPEVATFADAFTCLLRLGLLARCETPSGARLVPNPAPEPISPVLVLSDAAARLRDVRLVPHVDLRYLEGDMSTLACWSQGGRVTTPRTIAVRLSVPVADVVDVFRGRALNWPDAFDLDPREIGPDTAITLGAASSPT